MARFSIRGDRAIRYVAHSATGPEEEGLLRQCVEAQPVKARLNFALRFLEMAGSHPNMSFVPAPWCEHTLAAPDADPDDE